MSAQRRILRSPGSICSRPTNRSKPSSSRLLERSPLSITTSPKATRVQPCFRAASGIRRLLGSSAIEHLHYGVHLLPELAPPGIKCGPRGAKVAVAPVAHRFSQPSNVTRDGQVRALAKDVRRRRDRGEAGFVRERLVGLQDP